MKKINKEVIINIFLIIISIVYTIMVAKIDVRSIGPNNSFVGFSTVNKFFADLIGTNKLLYKVTEIFGLLAILIALLYGLKGLIQLIKRKNILKVNKELLAVGTLYIVVIMIYVFFEKFIINYRPVLIDGELEASYPSSHTMLAICICGSALIINKYLFKNHKFVKYYNTYIVILMVAIVLGRFLSGYHWFSDIIGGIIISLALLQSFKSILMYINKDFGK